MDITNEGCEAEHSAAAYRLILLMRRFEEKAGQLYAMGLIPDEIKLCIGREALFAGLFDARQPRDPVVVGRRSHGALLAFGLPPERIMSALAHPTGRLFVSPADYLSKANTRGPVDFYRCPLGNGARARWALSLAMVQAFRAKPNVVWVILDGDTVKHDDVARPLSFAQRARLPIVFVVDHAVPDPSPRPMGGDGAYDAGGLMQSALQASPISFTSVDGIDPQTVMTACRSASAGARAGGGPQGLLVSTQAFRGHARLPAAANTAAGAAYAGPAIDHDPVSRARARLVAASCGETDTAVAIETDVRTTLTTVGLKIRAQAQL